jgi:hypothetical protein
LIELALREVEAEVAGGEGEEGGRGRHNRTTKHRN